MVLPPQKPTIEINGTSNLPRDYEDFRLGVRVFSDVRVTISSDGEDEEWRNGKCVNIFSIYSVSVRHVFKHPQIIAEMICFDLRGPRLLTLVW